MDLILEDHPIMQWVLRFLLVYSLSEPSERSQKAQEFATTIAKREQDLLSTLQRLVDAVAGEQEDPIELERALGKDAVYALDVARAALVKG